ncbi:MAG: acetolactate synthase large subunit, partial [Desulfobia sp.]
MKAAELFVRCLENEGVDYIFGVPGEENAQFLMALENSTIQFILCRHEQGAAFMAGAYGRLTGRAGVCLGTLGPGATNLVTGVADANMDRSPLVVITAQADSTRQHKESHQSMDVVGMFRPITKWAQPIRHPHNIPEVVRKAFQLARQQKTGACHIELADDIAALEVNNHPIPLHTSHPPVADSEIIDEALALILQARKPVILAGNGVLRGRASPALQEFSEKTGIGVVSTFMGKGAVPRKSPYCLFTIGLQTRDYTWDAVNDADLVITLGYDLVEYPPAIWNQCDRPVRIIHVDFLPAEADDYYRVDLEVVGDLKNTLEVMNKLLERNSAPEFTLSYQKELREKMLEDFRQYKDDNTQGQIRPQKIIWDIREVMGEEDILLADVGAHKMWTARYYHCDRPNTCIITNGFCSMGFA